MRVSESRSRSEMETSLSSGQYLITDGTRGTGADNWGEGVKVEVARGVPDGPRVGEDTSERVEAKGGVCSLSLGVEQVAEKSATVMIKDKRRLLEVHLRIFLCHLILIIFHLHYR